MAWGKADFSTVGNLTADPELKMTERGKAFCSISLAVERSRKDQQTGDYIKKVFFMNNIMVWGKQAENLAKYASKGTQVMIDGEIDDWTDRDGNKRPSYTGWHVWFTGTDRLSDYAREHGEPVEPGMNPADDNIPF